ncbi:cyclic nucleotide-binding domain-containing protein [bacterium]|nr:cyclic nucleotide-binding domain-containing protein [bacterium]
MEEAGGDIGSFLKCVDLFQDLDDAEVAALIAKAQEERYEDKAFLFRETEAGDAMYVILDGTVKMLKLVAGNKFKTLVAMGVGEFFGEMALLDGHPRSATAAAHGVARVLKIGREEFSALMTENPYLGLKVVIRLARNLTERLRRTNDQVVEMVSWNLQQKDMNKQLEGR